MDSIADTASHAELYIHDYLRLIWRRKWVVVATVVLVTAAALGVTVLLITPKYQSDSQILQQQSGLDKALLGSDLFQQSSSEPQREIQTEAELVKSPEVSAAVSNKLGARLKGKDPASFIEVDPVSDADIIDITATSSDPQLATDIANAYATEYVNWRQKVDQDVLTQAQAPIEKQLAGVPADQQDTASYSALKDKLDSLKLVEAAQVGNLEIVKKATPSTAPSSPKPVRTGVMALFAGIIFGVGITFTIDHFDTKIRSTDEIISRVKKPILATVPMAHSNGSLITLSNPSGPSSEAYRMLKTNLGYLEPDRDVKTIMVTSPQAEEGKSTTIANLAVTMARAGQKVIVLEADWRRPVLARNLNLDNSFGVTNVLSGGNGLRETLQMIDAKDLMIYGNDNYWHNGAGANPGPHFNGVKPIYCAASGPIPPNPGELAASDKLGELISEACNYADVVLIDTPPFGIVGDAASIASKVDGVLLVVRLAQTEKRSLDMMQNFIDSVPSNILGIVVTDADAGESYGYYYGGYYYGS